MKIALIGAGMIGGTLGRIFLKRGHDIAFGTRHPERVTISGTFSLSVHDAAAWGELIVLAIPIGQTERAAREIGAGADKKILVDTGNPYSAREPDVAQEIARSGRGSGIWVASHFPKSKVVKAFNTVYFKTLMVAQTWPKTDALGIPIAGDDVGALETVSSLISQVGYEAVVVGALIDAEKFDVGTDVWNSGATASTLRKMMNLPQTFIQL